MLAQMLCHKYQDKGVLRKTDTQARYNTMGNFNAAPISSFWIEKIYK